VPRVGQPPPRSHLGGTRCRHAGCLGNCREGNPLQAGEHIPFKPCRVKQLPSMVGVPCGLRRTPVQLRCGPIVRLMFPLPPCGASPSTKGNMHHASVGGPALVPIPHRTPCIWEAGGRARVGPQASGESSCEATCPHVQVPPKTVPLSSHLPFDGQPPCASHG